MKYKSGQPLSEQQIQMHNEKIAALLTQAFSLQHKTDDIGLSINNIKLGFTGFLDLLNKGEI